MISLTICVHNYLVLIIKEYIEVYILYNTFSILYMSHNTYCATLEYAILLGFLIVLSGKY